MCMQSTMIHSRIFVLILVAVGRTRTCTGFALMFSKHTCLPISSRPLPEVGFEPTILVSKTSVIANYTIRAFLSFSYTIFLFVLSVSEKLTVRHQDKSLTALQTHRLATVRSQFLIQLPFLQLFTVGR